MNIRVTIKWYSALIAYTTGPLFMLGPVASAFYYALVNPDQDLLSYPFVVRLLVFLFGACFSGLFIYQMHDCLRKVEVQEGTVTWYYLFAPTSRSIRASRIKEIRPLQGAVRSLETTIIDNLFGQTRGFSTYSTTTANSESSALICAIQKLSMITLNPCLAKSRRSEHTLIL
ncbi:MAG: hypothetical protein HQL32_12740 [Planctomycetes bacterium]|nr:hypothetical protein [Planctomycetota bacterium]